MLTPLEMAVQQRATKAFISADSTMITLRRDTVGYVHGTKQIMSGGLIDPQTFKLIWEGNDGIVEQPPNGTRRFDFVLIGEHDANVAIGDYWKTGDQEHRIEWISPFNGYEVKAGGYSHGPKPT